MGMCPENAKVTQRGYEEMFRSLKADDETVKLIEEQKRIIALADQKKINFWSW